MKQGRNSFAHTEDQKGFTLIEVLMVITIVTVLAATSAPFYSRFILQNATANTADQIAEMLREAQIYSLSGKDGSDWSVAFDENKLTLNRISPSTIFLSYAVNPNVHISGLTQVVFYRPAGAPSPTGSFGVSGGNNTRTIDLNSQGMINVH